MDRSSPAPADRAPADRAHGARFNGGRATGRAALLVLVGLAGTTGCGDDGGNVIETETEAIGSGFLEDDDDGHGPSATDPTVATSTGSGPDTNGEGHYETLGDGDLRGLLTFALYPADALTPEDIVGIAGAWRTKDTELAIEDFFGVWGLQTAYPPPPEEPDTLEHNDLLAGFDWDQGKETADDVVWLLAGNAMKLVSSENTAQACLLYLGNNPDYPIYAATHSSAQPEGCAPEPDSFVPDAEYDIVLYGGDLFVTNALDAQVHTPPAFEVTAPSFEAFGAPVDHTDDLVIQWSGDGNEGNRITIRVSDMFGRMFTIHARDDGEYAIPASALDVLEEGPLTITVARENLETVPFTDGTVKVLTRFERWGYFELI